MLMSMADVYRKSRTKIRGIQIVDEVVELCMGNTIQPVFLCPHPLGVVIDMLLEDRSIAPRILILKNGQAVADVGEDVGSGVLVADALADAEGEEIGVFAHDADECGDDL